MTKTTTFASVVLAVAMAAGAGACKKQEMPAGDGKAGESAKGAAPAGDKAGAAGSGVAPAKTVSPGGLDPEKGEFTLDEATAGLAGNGKLMAKISTAKGDMVCELFPDKAPKTVASFVGLARGLRPWMDPETREWKTSAYFDGLAFHRVIPAFMIQGGDLLSRNYSDPGIGGGGPGWMIPNETSPDLTFDRPGRLAMANAGPDTNGSQFFITEVPRPQLDGGYTIFGQCEPQALDVVKTIARVPVDSPRHNKPLDAITMRVEIFRR